VSDVVIAATDAMSVHWLPSTALFSDDTDGGDDDQGNDKAAAGNNSDNDENFPCAAIAVHLSIWRPQCTGRQSVIVNIA
jgi:hypothetical protein